MRKRVESAFDRVENKKGRGLPRLIIANRLEHRQIAPATARNYDCTKAGNANKAACKGTVAPASTSAAPAKPAAATRNYDCSKPGNANKAVCRAAASAAAPTSAPAAKPTRNYDCSKAGNANKAVCKGAATTSTASTQPTSAPSQPTARPATPTATTSHPAGSPTAKCKDGTLSYSATHSGSCSHHGGVASWL